MKIQEQDFYFGCALAQIADHVAASTTVTKIEGKTGLYEINGDRQILIKYSTVEGNEWAFTFPKDEIATLKPNDAHTLFFVVHFLQASAGLRAEPRILFNYWDYTTAMP
jgi:hypothetical protein